MKQKLKIKNMYRSLIYKDWNYSINLDYKLNQNILKII